ncbi:MAG: DUF2155 domain-containing protein [Holosporaceae bacterium]|jgi:hypothetical protein|nr:DUF2155 domain-containing protein [Holosporaceae bacterium]
MMRKAKEFFLFPRKLGIFLLLTNVFLLDASYKATEYSKSSGKKPESNESFGEEPSIWESLPIEMDNVNIQILDKISGKVYRENIKLNSVKIFRSIGLELKKCFKNSPEEDKEISAFIKIIENGKVIFSNWLFASSPSINLFSHPMYDIRIEF